jgi:hypothetical protein
MIVLAVLIVLFCGLICSLAGYYISAEKGRGGFEGLLLGFLFGPFGLLLTVLMPPPAVRLEPFLPFRTVMGMIAFCIFGLFVMGTVFGTMTALTGDADKAAVPKPEPARTEFQLPPPGDPMLPYVVGGLGVAAMIMIFVYIHGPKRNR